jgi:hypothetical protein
MILIARARSLVHWCDGEQNKIRMQQRRVKISGSKIGNSGKQHGNRGRTRASRSGKVVDPANAGHRERSTRLGMRAARSVVGRPTVGTIGAMANDPELAGRMRQLIGNDPELTEKKMFGGLAFLIRGNMAIAASGQGGAMVRVNPAQSDALVATTTATLMHMRGRTCPDGCGSVPTICAPTTS